MSITNKPIVNRDVNQAVIIKLKAEITNLEAQNRKLKEIIAEKGISIEEHIEKGSDSLSVEMSQLQESYGLLQKQYQQLREEADHSAQRERDLTISHHSTLLERDLLRAQLDAHLKAHPSLSPPPATTPSFTDRYRAEIATLKQDLTSKDTAYQQLYAECEKMAELFEKD